MVSKSIILDGIEYPSVVEAAAKTGLCYSSLYQRLRGYSNPRINQKYNRTWTDRNGVKHSISYKE